ncbi:MAG TPA: SEC-C metal-binding domain-containing protein, partial [Candidatus Doudnabacteria bacterium]|nr:SEC-C metal-binding domain-containing protein [Candidatus Doudnabacteria bacterium]
QAGRLGAVTVATNIAGRGVDILLGGNPVDKTEGEQVRKAGGLAVIGTERHESRRIDNQLRGRAGRQGDPGSSQFYVSMADDLMRLFGGARMQSMMETLKIPDDQPIEAKMVSRSIESAQKKIEGLNFDTRKHVLEFDDVLNHQRKKIYSRRRQYLAGEEELTPIREEIIELFKERLASIVKNQFAVLDADEAITQILAEASSILPQLDTHNERIKEALLNVADREFVLLDELTKLSTEGVAKKAEEIGVELYDNILRTLVLQIIDKFWMEHLDTMDHLRDSVRLRGYGQRDPLVEYKKEGHQLFQRLLAEIDGQILSAVLRIGVESHLDKSGEQHHHATINLSGSTNSSAPQTVVEELKDPRTQGLGRNDPCYCGSSKKYKKCGLINSAEHQQNLAKV